MNPRCFAEPSNPTGDTEASASFLQALSLLGRARRFVSAGHQQEGVALTPGREAFDRDLCAATVLQIAGIDPKRR